MYIKTTLYEIRKQCPLITSSIHLTCQQSLYSRTYLHKKIYTVTYQSAAQSFIFFAQVSHITDRVFVLSEKTEQK